ncbi:phage shock protein C (PspC) family protein [Georgenia satyanarayanai]|uniref:Phage shock protein C (PspC) family protein n=1 Tax=Georgenia satyanarayanai TaxID=860221 RepID=A0A2Y9C4R1_9MICO|nr:PspC domain-containing protein [Georgenia satyanarayanai]PYG00634.1 phage shock protein C (PspC) family protein [Georgenia satyanarayanai]SSA40023.1 phage shock protein C (PspC) family protein [Georgenia satyanarayanai]
MNGQSAPHTSPPPPPAPSTGFFDSVRRVGIWRGADRWAGGVAAGIGRRYGLDPLLVRGLLVVVTLFGGLGLVLYGLAWALLPEEADGRIHLEEALRGRIDIALAGAAAVLVIGLSRPVFWWGAAWWSVPWVLIVAGVIVLVIMSKDRDTTTAPPPPGSPPPVAAGTPATPPPPAAPRPAYDVPEDAMPANPAPATGETSPSTEVIEAPTLPMSTSPGTTTEGVPGPTEPTAPAGPGATAPGEGGWQGSGAWHGGSGAGGPDDWDGTGWSGGQTPPAQPPAPPQPPVPPRPPVPGPGSRTTSLVLAICLLGAAGVALAHQQGVLDANPWLIGGGGVLTVLGAAVLVSGVRGRSQGGIGVLALLVALVMVPAAAAAATLPGFARFGADATTWAGDPTWAPRTAEEAEGGYSLVAGQLEVDLRALEEDAVVPVDVTFGNLTLIVPDDADITVNAEVAAGEVVGPLDDDWSGPGAPWWGSTRTDDSITNGTGISTTLVQEGSGRGPQIVVDAGVTFGQLYIEETS